MRTLAKGFGIRLPKTITLTFGERAPAAAYLGLRPRQRQSGERDPQLGITKSGDSYLRGVSFGLQGKFSGQPEFTGDCVPFLDPWNSCDR